MQKTINSDLPDGYKLAKTGGGNNVFPTAAAAAAAAAALAHAQSHPELKLGGFKEEMYSGTNKIRITLPEKNDKSLN